MQQKTSNGETGMQAPPAWLVGLFLVLITLALYWPVRHFEFNNYDDKPYVTENPYVQNGLTLPAVKWAFTAAGYAGNWHPLTWLSHLLDIQLFGFNAGAHHFTNVLFHTANTLLLFLLLHSWTGDLWRPAFVAALFGWHPLHVESVAWVAERKDVLSAFFWMLTLLAYGRYARGLKNHNSNCKIYYGLALLCFALGLMSKPMLVSLPIIMLLLDYWPLGRIYDLRFAIHGSRNDKTDLECHLTPAGTVSLGRAVVEKVPFFLLSVVSCVVTFLTQKKSGAVQNLSSFPLTDRLANALVSYSRYLGKIFWPAKLAAAYPYVHDLHPPEVLAAAILLLAISALAVYFAKGHATLFVGWLWFLIALIPVIGLVQVGSEALADRYTYIPAIGVFLIVAWEVPRWLSARADGSIILPSAIIILAGCLLASAHQISYWRNSVTLWTHAIEVTKDNSKAESGLGQALDAQGRVAEAMQHTRAALKIKPDDIQAENNLGCTLAEEGKWDEAIACLSAAIKLQPKYDRTYFNLGLTYMRMGRLEEAVGPLRTFIHLNSHYLPAYTCLGDILAKQGHIDEAIEQYRAALRLAPKDKETQEKLRRLQK